MKYNNEDIKQSVYDFLGEDGRTYFQKLKDEHGTCWVAARRKNMIIHNWTHEGRRIKNHITDKFPDIVVELGDYAKFEDYVYGLVEDMFE